MNICLCQFLCQFFQIRVSCLNRFSGLTRPFSYLTQRSAGVLSPVIFRLFASPVSVGGASVRVTGIAGEGAVTRSFGAEHPLAAEGVLARSRLIFHALR